MLRVAFHVVRLWGQRPPRSEPFGRRRPRALRGDGRPLRHPRRESQAYLRALHRHRSLLPRATPALRHVGRGPSGRRAPPTAPSGKRPFLCRSFGPPARLPRPSPPPPALLFRKDQPCLVRLPRRSVEPRCAALPNHHGPAAPRIRPGAGPRRRPTPGLGRAVPRRIKFPASVRFCVSLASIMDFGVVLNFTPVPPLPPPGPDAHHTAVRLQSMLPPRSVATTRIARRSPTTDPGFALANTIRGLNRASGAWVGSTPVLFDDTPPARTLRRGFPNELQARSNRLVRERYTPLASTRLERPRPSPPDLADPRTRCAWHIPNIRR